MLIMKNSGGRYCYNEFQTDYLTSKTIENEIIKRLLTLHSNHGDKTEIRQSAT